jgi:hypothetical protein
MVAAAEAVCSMLTVVHIIHLRVPHISFCGRLSRAFWPFVAEGLAMKDGSRLLASLSTITITDYSPPAPVPRNAQGIASRKWQVNYSGPYSPTSSSPERVKKTQMDNACGLLVHICVAIGIGSVYCPAVSRCQAEGRQSLRDYCRLRDSGLPSA